MRFTTKIQPRYIIAITAAIALLMVFSAYYELRESRQELYHILEEEALSLIETIEQSSRNTIISTRQIEEQLSDRLFNNAFFIAHLDSLNLLDNRQLGAFAVANNIFRINIFDSRGLKVLTSYTPHDDHAGFAERNSPLHYIAPILDGTLDRILIGLKEARYTEEQRFAVAVRRTGHARGAIVLNLDAADLLEYRKTIGIGKLLQDLGDNSGIIYVALQDGDGIIAASRAVKELSSFPDDSVLALTVNVDSAVTRTAGFGGNDVFEVLHRLKLGDELVGVLRIGLAMDEAAATEARMQRRIIIMSAVLLILGTLMVLAIVAIQNFKLIEARYGAIRTFTGNILEHMQDAVVTIDDRRRVTLFNRQAQTLFGVRESDAVGKEIGEIGSGNTVSPAGVFASAQPHEEIVLEGPGQSRRDLAVTRSETVKADGTKESTTAVIRDLTEARRLQEEIQRREKLTAMGELASTVAHEIRNPLNAISMIAQRFEKEYVPREGAEEYHSLAVVMRTEAQRVNNIIHRFLRFARPPKIDIRAIPARAFVDHVSNLFASQAKEKGVTFTARTEFDGQLSLDREQMTQALLNLLQNALDATPPGGSISLTSGPEDGWHEFRVTDTGSGIPPKEKDKIFNLYYSTKPDGTGMGLAIVQQIASQHGGMVDVSPLPGRGTRFTVRIPLRPSSTTG